MNFINTPARPLQQRYNDGHMDNHNILELKNISKSYQEGTNRRHVLDGVSAAFPTGQFTVILGKSGSGKSTLLNLISGIDYPESGQVWLAGRELTALDERQRTLFRRENIGFVFQFFNLIPTLTVLENVTLPLELGDVSPKAARAQAEPLLEAVELLDRADAFPDRLSGGEQQRVALARALIHDPLLVLADEPTGNLDRKTSETILNLLDRLTHQAGKNLVMATHSVSSAQSADLVYRLEGGQLVKQR